MLRHGDLGADRIAVPAISAASGRNRSIAPFPAAKRMSVTAPIVAVTADIGFVGEVPEGDIRSTPIEIV